MRQERKTKESESNMKKFNNGTWVWDNTNGWGGEVVDFDGVDKFLVLHPETHLSKSRQRWVKGTNLRDKF